MEDLWPSDIEINQVKTPVSILKEQARLLGEKNQNIVQASIRTRQVENHLGDLSIMLENPRKKGMNKITPTPFQYDFFIEAPTLNYKYKLFYICHSIDLYPVDCILDEDLARELFPDSQGIKLTINNEEEFLELLKVIFKADKTIKIIGALFSQAT